MLCINSIFKHSYSEYYTIFEGKYFNANNSLTLAIIDAKIWVDDERDLKVWIKLAVNSEYVNYFSTRDSLQGEKELFEVIKKDIKFEKYNVSLPEFVFSGPAINIRKDNVIFENYYGENDNLDIMQPYFFLYKWEDVYNFNFAENYENVETLLLFIKKINVSTNRHNNIMYGQDKNKKLFFFDLSEMWSNSNRGENINSNWVNVKTHLSEMWSNSNHGENINNNWVNVMTHLLESLIGSFQGDKDNQCSQDSTVDSIPIDKI